VAEVGVYLPETSNILDYIKQGIRTTLVEADPRCVTAIREYFGDTYPITLHPVAVFDSEGSIELINRAASTFASVLNSSPALVNDAYQKQDTDKFTVPAKRFDSLDDGTIDLLSIDIEGCEWYVLKYMKSRPAVISVETHGKRYINPFINEITDWMKKTATNFGIKTRATVFTFVAGYFLLPMPIVGICVSMNGYLHGSDSKLM